MIAETRYYSSPSDAVAEAMRYGRQGHHVRSGREPAATLWYVHIRPAEASE